MQSIRLSHLLQGRSTATDISGAGDYKSPLQLQEAAFRGGSDAVFPNLSGCLWICLLHIPPAIADGYLPGIDFKNAAAGSNILRWPRECGVIYRFDQRDHDHDGFVIFSCKRISLTQLYRSSHVPGMGFPETYATSAAATITSSPFAYPEECCFVHLGGPCLGGQEKLLTTRCLEYDPDKRWEGNICHRYRKAHWCLCAVVLLTACLLRREPAPCLCHHRRRPLHTAQSINSPTAQPVTLSPCINTDGVAAPSPPTCPALDGVPQSATTVLYSAPPQSPAAAPSPLMPPSSPDHGIAKPIHAPTSLSPSLFLPSPIHS
ncbi:hypothetical protein M0R45_031246 [Rubus argutus]|uniref:Uncharacterized protein n=1 Tax=Rubus argutus TaxID=59490 RepID=A0AAW1WGX1_RUBAR